MSNDNPSTPTPTPVDDKEDLYVFNVALSFMAPFEGTVSIAAKDEQDAIDQIVSLFDKRQDLKIVKVYKASRVQHEVDNPNDPPLMDIDALKKALN
jgi:hypothetical protein